MVNGKFSEKQNQNNLQKQSASKNWLEFRSFLHEEQSKDQMIRSNPYKED